MNFHMDKALKFWVEHEYDMTKQRCPMLRRSEIIAGILGEYEHAGHATRFLRKDGKIGWRATDKMREDLFEQEQDAIDEFY